LSAPSRSAAAGTGAEQREADALIAREQTIIRVTSDEGNPRGADRKPNQDSAETRTPHEGH
jgi:hypothetical protein